MERSERIEKTLRLAAEAAELGLDDLDLAISILERELAVLQLFRAFQTRSGPMPPAPPTTSAPVLAESTEPVDKLDSFLPLEIRVTPPTPVVLDKRFKHQEVPVKQPRSFTSLEHLPPPLPPIRPKVVSDRPPPAIVRDGSQVRTLAFTSVPVPAIGEETLTYDPADDEAARLSRKGNEKEAEDEDAICDDPPLVPPGEQEEVKKYEKAPRVPFVERMMSIIGCIASGITKPKTIGAKIGIHETSVYGYLRDARMMRYVQRLELGVYGLTEDGNELAAATGRTDGEDTDSEGDDENRVPDVQLQADHA